MIDTKSIETLFLGARTHSYWQQRDVDEKLLHTIYELARMGPTSANCCPMRVAFVKSKEAKEKLKPCLDGGNVEKTMSAPVTAIIAYDEEFYEKLPKLFPHTDAKSWFVGKPEKIEETAFRNGSIEGGYFILAARAVGLDCGPMSGFNRKKCDEAFFAGTKWRSNFLCNLGYGNTEKLHPRNPRPEFAEACKIL